MAWRSPRFAYLHAARDVGVGSITPNAAFTAGDDKYLIDDRPAVQFTWSNSAATHTIDVDLGAGVTGINRLWIPNHDIAGAYLVREDSVDTFDSGDLLTLGSGTAVAGTDIDKTLTANSERYLRFEITPAGAWSLGQLMFTETITLAAGVEPGPGGWTDEPVPNVLQLEGGDSLQFDPDQRFFEFRYPNLGDVAATDLTKLEALFAAVSTYRPFLLDPPYDTESVLFVKLAERPRVQVNPMVPASEDRKADVRFSVLEYLG